MLKTLGIAELTCIHLLMKDGNPALTNVVLMLMHYTILNLCNSMHYTILILCNSIHYTILFICYSMHYTILSLCISMHCDLNSLQFYALYDFNSLPYGFFLCSIRRKMCSAVPL